MTTMMGMLWCTALFGVTLLFIYVDIVWAMIAGMLLIVSMLATGINAVFEPERSTKRRLMAMPVTSLVRGDVIRVPLRPWVAGIVDHFVLDADLVVVKLHGGGHVTYPYGTRIKPLAVDASLAPEGWGQAVRMALAYRGQPA